MLAMLKTVLAVGTVLTATTSVCALCEIGVPSAHAANVATAVQMADTASVRLHISGMTCGTCPVTARLALRKLVGVYSAVVTLDDSLGVVRYDPRRLTRDQIATHLTNATGYGARVLPENATAKRKSGTN